MFDVSLIIVGALVVIMVSAAVEFYRQLRRAQKEYEKAKEVIDDIVFSFSRELKQEAEKLESTIYKVETTSAKSDRALKKAEEVDKKILSIDAKINETLEERTKILPKLDELDKQTRDIVASHEALTSKIATIEDRIQHSLISSETKIEAVIPIKREKALSPLTPTELAVLEMLSSEGPKTAPEIKDRIKLSREHTARLMKKLYEEGYLDRETGKIPFKYSVKKEMEGFLKKSANETTPSV